MAFRTLDEADLNGKRVLLRVDLNVPMENGRVTDATRVERVAGTIREIAEKGGRVILLAHFGRPKGRNPEESLRPVAAEVERVLGKRVAFAEDCIGPQAEEAVAALKNGQILLLENTRFHAGEEANDEEFVKELAALGDVYVNDAFSAAHRAHASTEGLAARLPAYAGRTMQSELAALTRGLESPERPVVAVVGGAKVSTKIDLLENLVARVDSLVIGGGMANTFLSAIGYNIGRSLAERDLAATAMRILDRAKRTGCAVFLPVDGVVATEFKAHAPHRTYAADMIPSDGMILDVGAQSVDRINAAISDARTLVWNGPLGAFEIAPFDQGTVMAARHAADRTRQGKLVSIAGGGDTVAALNHAGVADKFTYVSTAGGAFLEWLEGKSLPGVEALRKAPAADEGPQEPPEPPPGGAARETRDPEPATDQAPEPAETAAAEDVPELTADVAAETPSPAAKKRAAAKTAPTRKSAPTKKAAEAAGKVMKRLAKKAEKTPAKKPAAKAPAKKTPAAGSSGAAAKAPVKAPARTAAKAGAKTAKKSARSAPSKTAAKKAPAAKTAAKKTAAKKSPARATSARKTSVKKTPAKKAQATKSAVKKAAAKKTPARKPAAKKAAVGKTPARKSAKAPARPAKTSKATAASRRAKAARPAATARASKSAKSTRAAKVAKPVKSAKAAKAAKPMKRSAKARPAARNSKARRR